MNSYVSLAIFVLGAPICTIAIFKLMETIIFYSTFRTKEERKWAKEMDKRMKPYFKEWKRARKF